MPSSLDIADIHASITAANPEANVIIVLFGDGPQIKVCPNWECEMTFDDLQSHAITEAMLFAEEVGGGTVTSTIIDLRNPTAALVAATQ